MNFQQVIDQVAAIQRIPSVSQDCCTKRKDGLPQRGFLVADLIAMILQELTS